MHRLNRLVERIAMGLTYDAILRLVPREIKWEIDPIRRATAPPNIASEVFREL